MLAVLAWRGCFRRDALRLGPDRSVGLVPADLIVALGLMLVGQALGVLLAQRFVPVDPQGDAENLPALARVLRVLISQGMGQLPPVAYLLWRAAGKDRGLRRIGAVPRHPFRDVAWGALGLLAAIPLVMSTMLIATMIGQSLGYPPEPIGHKLLELLGESDSMLASALMVVSAAVIAPVLEEMFYRGLLQSVVVEALGKDKRWIAVLSVGLFFPLAHLGGVSWQALPGLFVFGVLLGWLYERSGSLWPSIFVHAGFNSFNIVLALLLQAQPAGSP